MSEIDLKDSRQVKRAMLRFEVMSQFSREVLPTDDHGVIPRRVRRSMAHGLFKRMWRDAVPELRGRKWGQR